MPSVSDLQPGWVEIVREGQPVSQGEFFFSVLAEQSKARARALREQIASGEGAADGVSLSAWIKGAALIGVGALVLWLMVRG